MPATARPAGVPVCDRHLTGLRDLFGGTVSSVVYYVTWDDGATVKIGTSTNPRQRFLDHRAASGAYVRALAAHPGARQEERTQHRRFRHLLIPGQRELFRAGPELAEHIDNVRLQWPNWKELLEATSSAANYRPNNRNRRTR